MLKVEGIIPAMVTPFDDYEQVNEAALQHMINRLIGAGVHGLFCLGTNGEFYSLTFDEKIRIIELIVEEAKGRLPVYAGVGSISTEETVRLAKRAEVAGASALSIITPYFLSYTQDELIDHYEKIANATTLPIVLYNIPSRTANPLLPKTVERLARIPNIVGIKDSSGSYDTILQYIDHTPADFAVLAGTDSLILSTLMAGGKGAIAATANVFPETVASIYEHWKNKDYIRAEEAQNALRPLRNAFSLGTLPSVLKGFLNELGIEAGLTRRPVSPITPDVRQQIKDIIKTYKQSGYLI